MNDFEIMELNKGTESRRLILNKMKIDCTKFEIRKSKATGHRHKTVNGAS